MKRATKQDAKLLLGFIQTFDTHDMKEAMNWFHEEFAADDYKEFKSKYPKGSPGLRHIGAMLSKYEVAGALVSQGLLNEDLYFDVSEIGFVWEKLGKIVSGWQKDASPQLWENAVWLAERQKKWSKEVWKPNQKWKLKT
ncbi:MAG: hypothetical protein ABSF83_14180 [Nitrososphaerales archaeon]